MFEKGPYLFQQLLNALQLAGFYLPLAVAFSLIQAISGRVFLSFGNVAMYGSFAAVYACFGFLLQGYDDGAATLLALGAAVLCAASLGLATGKIIFLPLAKTSSLAFMIGSIGFAIVLQELMRIATNAQDVWVPPIFAGSGFSILTGDFPIRVTTASLLGLSVSLLSIALTLVLMRFTRFGHQFRATADNSFLAQLCGVNTQRIFVLTFALGSGLAAVAGWMSAIIYGGTNFSVGLMLGFKAMFASLAGGEGRVSGAIVGAILLACIETAWSASFGSAYRDAGVFAVIILLLLLRQARVNPLTDTGESKL
ncbi:MAG TPA: branched-chain amino acid ABC transporter permease [Aestuariivirga sp.]